MFGLVDMLIDDKDVIKLFTTMYFIRILFFLHFTSSRATNEQQKKSLSFTLTRSHKNSSFALLCVNKYFFLVIFLFLVF